MNKKITRFFKEFFRIFLDFLTSENWMNCRLSWSSWKNVFFSYFSQKLVATRNVSVIIPDRIYFCPKKKRKFQVIFVPDESIEVEVSGAHSTDRNGRHFVSIDAQSRSFMGFFSVYCASGEHNESEVQPLTVRGHFGRRIIGCVEGEGWPFIRMKSTWITSILSFLGKEIGENQVEVVYWIKFYLNLIFEFFSEFISEFLSIF